MTGDRPPSVELRIESDSGQSSRSIPLSRTARAILAVTGLVVLAVVLTTAAVLPSALSAMRAAREHDLQLDRRVQLGNRLRALVGELSSLEVPVRSLEQRIRRGGRIYDVPVAPPVDSELNPVETVGGESLFASTIAHGDRMAGDLTARLDRVESDLARLLEWEQAHPRELAALPLGRPYGGELAVPVQGFGPRRAVVGGTELEFDTGVDVALPAGTPIVAPAAGTVLWAGEAPTGAGPEWWRLGRIVVVRHDEFWLTLYGHCGTLRVGRGQRVRAGDLLGTVGATGWAPAPQLHFETRRRTGGGEWQAVDAALLLGTGGTEGASATVSGGLHPPPLPRAFTR